ncbi:hypothetical protein HPB51_002275 [Rhipicephalus microplus]|uniref:Uncharacterized protein n=1 Tax=Rhipicephalus microplus TaxID=6941 RepID=A0A9J6DZ39_RHIMP|nr:hypothetical protein HPB51_002275 [Rhipicephalus microplus]
MFGPTTTVKLKSSRYVRNYLPAALRELPARAVMNYAAFLVLIRLAPFFPEKHLGLRQLFFKDLRGRTFADAIDSRVLCLMAVETVLPSCLVKVSMRQANDERERISNRLAYLENAFSRRISNLAWISEYEALVQRYQLKRRRLASFAHGNESCANASSAAGYPTGKPVEFYQVVARSQQRAKLSAQSTSSLPSALLSPLRTRTSYDASRQRVPVPAALFNASVPSKGTLFRLHLSRYAVRFYHALVEKLFNAVYDRSSIGFAREPKKLAAESPIVATKATEGHSDGDEALCLESLVNTEMPSVMNLAQPPYLCVAIAAKCEVRSTSGPVGEDPCTESGAQLGADAHCELGNVGASSSSRCERRSPEEDACIAQPSVKLPASQGVRKLTKNPDCRGIIAEETGETSSALLMLQADFSKIEVGGRHLFVELGRAVPLRSIVLLEARGALRGSAFRPNDTPWFGDPLP